MTELLPCPFCGNNAAKLVVRKCESNAKDVAFVECEACGGRGSSFDARVIYCANDEAYKAWNRRTEIKYGKCDKCHSKENMGLIYCSYCGSLRVGSLR